jgi:hypothetical protein
MKERTIFRQRQNTIRERGGGNEFRIKIYVYHKIIIESHKGKKNMKRQRRKKTKEN